MVKKNSFLLIFIVVLLLISCNSNNINTADVLGSPVPYEDIVYCNKNMIKYIINQSSYAFIFGNTRNIKNELEVYFVEKSVLGATSYQVEYSSDSGATWMLFIYNGVPLVINNEDTYLSIYLENPGLFRFKVIGGTYDGFYSQTIEAKVQQNNTYLTKGGYSYSINSEVGATDHSLDLHGPVTCFADSSIEDSQISLSEISYQWYLANPNDYSIRITLSGATDKEYVPKVAELGRTLIVRASHGTAYFETVMGPAVRQKFQHP